MRNLHSLKILMWKQPWRKLKQWNKKYEKCQFFTQTRPKNSIFTWNFENVWWTVRCSIKTAVLKNFLRKHLCWRLFLIKMQEDRPANLLKRHSDTGVFLKVIAKFLWTAILKNICERLLLRVFPFMLVWILSYMNK